MDEELRKLGLDADSAVDWNHPAALPRAQDYCRAFTLRHRENFRVVSLLLPSAIREHFYPIYAYCRSADDLADRVSDPRLSFELLAWWQAQLEACYGGACRHPIFAALRATIDEFQLSREPFLQLLQAFRRDQQQHDYEDEADLLSYCRCSADPVGRIILGLARSDSAERRQLSDFVCTGLQWINFCQDVARDWDRGRIYMLRSTRVACGYTDAMWQAREVNPAFRELIRCEVDRAERFLLTGAPLVQLVPRDFRFQVGFFVEGGLSIVRAIREIDYDVWSVRPVVGRFGQLAVVGRTLARRYGLTQWICNLKPAMRFVAK